MGLKSRPIKYSLIQINNSVFVFNTRFLSSIKALKVGTLKLMTINVNFMVNQQTNGLIANTY